MRRKESRKRRRVYFQCSCKQWRINFSSYIRTNNLTLPQIASSSEWSFWIICKLCCDFPSDILELKYFVHLQVIIMSQETQIVFSFEDFCQNSWAIFIQIFNYQWWSNLTSNRGSYIFDFRIAVIELFFRRTGLTTTTSFQTRKNTDFRRVQTRKNTDLWPETSCRLGAKIVWTWWLRESYLTWISMATC